jgi:serine phosphatase RsbU (regulator of sigma subunit)
LYYFRISQAIAEKQEDPSKLIAIYSNIGNVYGDIGQNKTCLSYYLKADEYTDKIQMPYRHAYMKVNIGTVYSVLGQHDSALVYYREGARILESLDKDNEKLNIVYGNIGATYLELKDTLQSESYFLEARRIAILHNNQRGMGSAYDHLAVVAFAKGLRDSALSSCHRALSIYYAIDAKAGISETCVHLGEMFASMKLYDSASFYLSKGARFAELIQDYYNLDNYYAKLSEVFEAKGKFDSALVYQRKLQAVKDTLYNLNKSNVVGEMRTQMENEKNQKEIELLNEKDARKTLVLYSAIVVAVLILLLGLLAFNRYLVKKRSNELLSKQNAEIQEQKEIIEEKNKDITDSIRYAKRIQDAILPAPEQMQAVFPESWCYFRPKDIVSGDFYWFEKEGDYRLFAVVDCTGHGVPGALLSVVGHNLLGKAVHDLKLVMPDQILSFMNEEIRRMLRHHDGDESAVQDGMDMALCSYHAPTKKLYFSGSINPLYLYRNGEFIEYKSDKILIGSSLQQDKSFTLHTIDAQPGDLLFLFSDGFADQFGGENGKKLKYKYFRQLLLTITGKPMEVQAEKLNKAFEDWKKGYDQVDDVCVVAVRL